MSESLHQVLAARLQDWQRQGLLRHLRQVDSAQGPRIKRGDRELLNFGSNDYLGLAEHPVLKEAAVRALERFGAGSGASRLLCGSLAPHHDLEEALAAFKGTEAALSFSSGYATAIGTICALMGRDDVIILDKLVHACLVDAARLSGATLRVCKHNDTDDLERLLAWAAARRAARPTCNILVLTESVFSMDGDVAPLRQVVELKDHFGAWLMVDEAHATGLYGPWGQGLAAEWGVAGRIEVQMGTLGKALGSAGGFIAGSRCLVDYLINRARSFVFSTAPPPAVAAAATAALRLVRSPEGAARRQQLWERVAGFRAALAKPAASQPTAIVPWPVGNEATAVALAARLEAEGLFVPAVRYPTVARGAARLRISLTAAHSAEDIRALAQALHAPGGDMAD